MRLCTATPPHCRLESTIYDPFFRASLNLHFHHGFPYYLYSALSAAAVIFALTAVPETKGKSLESIEVFWRPKRTKAANWA